MFESPGEGGRALQRSPERGERTKLRPTAPIQGGGDAITRREEKMGKKLQGGYFKKELGFGRGGGGGGGGGCHH